MASVDSSGSLLLCRCVWIVDVGVCRSSVCAGSDCVVECEVGNSLHGLSKWSETVCVSVSNFKASSSDELVVGRNVAEIEETDYSTVEAVVEGAVTSSAEYDTKTATCTLNYTAASDYGEKTVEGNFVVAS